MKTIKLFYFLLFLSVILSSCNKSEVSSEGELFTYTAKKIGIQYDNTKIGNILDNDSFIFDNHKMIHKDDFLKDDYQFSLPSSNPKLIETDSKVLQEKMNIISMALILANKLASSKEYNFINLRQTSINGKLIIERKDGKDITIKKLKSYPLFIDKYNN